MIVIKDKSPDKVIKGPEAIATMLVQRCAEKLQEHYPNHIWRVGMSGDQSVIYILNPAISQEYGYVLHTKDVQDDPSLKLVVGAGGEILERAYLIRGENTGVTPEKFDMTEVLRKRLADKHTNIKVLKNG